MAGVKPRVKAPRTAKRGEVITIKTLISHPMESGFRRDPQGALVPRKIINRFTVMFDGEEVARVDMGTAISANPYFEFKMRVPNAGTLRFEWLDDDGTTHVAEREIALA